MDITNVIISDRRVRSIESCENPTCVIILTRLAIETPNRDQIELANKGLANHILSYSDWYSARG